MSKIKRVMTVIMAGVFFACSTMFLVLMLVGAIEFARCIIDGVEPGVFEWFGIAFLAVFGGILGAIWASCDMDIETDYEKETYKRVKEEDG